MAKRAARSSKKGDHKKPKQPTEYQRERAKAQERKKKNGNYGIGL